jgi:hypothetical protein
MGSNYVSPIASNSHMYIFPLVIISLVIIYGKSRVGAACTPATARAATAATCEFRLRETCVASRPIAGSSNNSNTLVPHWIAYISRYDVVHGPIYDIWRLTNLRATWQYGNERLDDRRRAAAAQIETEAGTLSVSAEARRV